MDQARADALQEALTELGKSIAMGFVPYLGQAIDAYDTLESIWQLNASKKPEDKDEAKFQLVMALIGWIPGPGDGVKKSLRLVNKNPERFAPILFDLLRHVLELCEIKTSPETLLDQIFNASALKAQITKIREGIEDSSAFEALPETGQSIARSVLLTAEAELPMWIGLVSKKLLHWKRLQPNSSARAELSNGHKKTTKHEAKSPEVAKQGESRPVPGSAQSSSKAMVADAALELAQQQLGVLGEHIADYYCAEQLKWGSWKGHDQGSAGTWSNGKPGKLQEGKLSNKNKLFKLSSGPNGQGIDAVWRANSHNESKPYAIVEAKSDLERMAPKFLQKNPKSERKPSVTGKLGVSGIPDLETLLETEPPVAEDAPATTKAGGKLDKAKNKRVAKANKEQKMAASAPPKKIPKRGPFVQMSHDWIDKNMVKAVGALLARDILRITPPDEYNYSRHLIYAPMWSDVTIAHAKAVTEGNANKASTHAKHDLEANLHYKEDDVKKSVNKKKANLRAKYGDLPTLKAEK